MVSEVARDDAEFGKVKKRKRMHNNKLMQNLEMAMEKFK